MKHVISDDQIDRAVAAKCRLYGFSKWDLPGGLVQVYRREAAAMLEAAINGSE